MGNLLHGAKYVGLVILIVIIGTLLSSCSMESSFAQTESISIAEKPSKITYIKGETFSLSGLEIVAHTDRGDLLLNLEQEIIQSSIPEGAPLLETGEQLVVISYNDFQASFLIQVLDTDILALEILSSPDTTIYYAGEHLDLSGLQVRVRKSGGNTETIDWSTDSFFVSSLEQGAELTESDTSVTITYGDVSTSFPLMVLEKIVSSIEVLSLPDTISYYVDDTLDLSGLRILVTKKGGETETIEWSSECDLIASPEQGDTLREETDTVIIKYQGETTSFQIEVLSRMLSSISIENLPRTSYAVGQVLDLSELVLSLLYDNGTTKTLAYNGGANGISVEIPSLDDYGPHTVTIQYQEKETSFEATVHRYMAGTINRKACYWKDDEITILGVSDSFATDIYVDDDGTVYVTGREDDKACYWVGDQTQKRELGITGISSLANAIKVTADGDVYVAGRWDDLACYWINDKNNKIMLGDDSNEYKNSWGFGLDVTEDGDVYVAGYDYYPEGNCLSATYWVNDREHRINLSPTNTWGHFSRAVDIVVTEENTVYVAGTAGGSCYWVNDSYGKIRLAGEEALSIDLDLDGNIYVSGCLRYIINQSPYVACYWKNGKDDVTIWGDDVNSSKVQDIKILDNGTIHAVGYEYRVSPYNSSSSLKTACYWGPEGNKVLFIENLYDNSEVVAIF